MHFQVTDQEWDYVSRFLSPPPKKKSWQGRPRASDRHIFEAILCVLITGCRWADLDPEYPAKSSCHKRFQTWAQDGSLLKLHKGLVRVLKKKRRLDLSEGFTDTAFIKAKKGDHWLARALEGKVQKYQLSQKAMASH